MDSKVYLNMPPGYKHIKPDSWLNNPEYEDFRIAWLQIQMNGESEAAKVAYKLTPEEAYHLFAGLKKGSATHRAWRDWQETTTQISENTSQQPPLESGGL